MVHEMTRAGVSLEDLETMFHFMDLDGSGDLTYDEVVDGFLRMRMVSDNLQRPVNGLRQAFKEADRNETGVIFAAELDRLLRHPRILHKLGLLSILDAEVEAILNHAAAFGYKEISCDRLVSIFLTVREKGPAEMNGLSVLRRAFVEATSDAGSDTLTRSEMQSVFCRPDFAEKLERLHLRQPAWMKIFDALDLDHNGVISWAELSKGVPHLWKELVGRTDSRRAQQQYGPGVRRASSVAATRAMSFGEGAKDLSRRRSDSDLGA
eukprot:NODE_2787_length_875_cov_236.979268.p2 GENE.NODE_2787_length_875_cov_236.979268~~NODE_2787_length_875_cov_236.979268.p2  ORF type:complete len:275 (+),score=81.48 NODE_2787_length_875_cov_236.979268:31-825(+)